MRSPSDITHNGRTLADILEDHRKWRLGEGGSRANLSRADLSGAYLSDANLSDAYLSDAYLSDANLSGADLSRANLSGANLSGAYLSDANLSRASAVIDLGVPDGWRAVAWLMGQEMQVRVGCRSFSLAHGLEYWAGKRDRREVMAALEYAMTIARIREWDAVDLEEPEPATA